MKQPCIGLDGIMLLDVVEVPHLIESNRRINMPFNTNKINEHESNKIDGDFGEHNPEKQGKRSHERACNARSEPSRPKNQTALQCERSNVREVHHPEHSLG